MTDRKITQLAISALQPYEKNSRTHTAEQTAMIADSIRAFGFINPVLVAENNIIIAGHGRVSAAKMIGMTEVPCLMVDGLSDEQIKAYVIADNKLAEAAGWDVDLLKMEIADLAAVNFNTGLLGFSDDELHALLAVDAVKGLADPDEIPPAPVESVSRPGDLWLLGPHRLLCGSSTVEQDVTRLLAGTRPHLMVTDPPYGVNYDASWREKLHGGAGDIAAGKVMNDDKADWREAWRLFPGDCAYVWHAGNLAHIVADSLIACGFNLYAQIIWVKSSMVIGRGHYHPMHEPCWYAVRKGRTGHFRGGRKQKTVWKIAEQGQVAEVVYTRTESDGTVYAVSGDESTVWEIPKPQKSETGHSTQKPVECMARPIRNNSNVGDLVYEPFSGSGTTIVAAELTGRICYAMELSPAYCDVAVQRWENLTGKTAERQ